MTISSVSLIRTEGVGRNFMVIDPEDGFRKDDTLWFGTCDSCGERVSSSLHDKGIWMHTIVTSIKYHDSGHILSQQSYQSDRCPKKD